MIGLGSSRPRPRSTVRSTWLGAISGGGNGARVPARTVDGRAVAGAPATRRAASVRDRAGEPEPRRLVVGAPSVAVIARRFGFIAPVLRSPAALPGDLVGGEDRSLAADALWGAGRRHH